MKLKSLPAADNYFIISENGEKVGLSKLGVCYEIRSDGRTVPVRYGDECIRFGDNECAVRLGARTFFVAL